MKFLEQPPRFLFFTGKGGVGKTSIACATAIQLAEGGANVLLVSTDPASNVGQVFGVDIGNRITAIPAVPRLSALEIDPQAAAQAYRDRIVGPVRGVLPDAVVKGIEEQLSGGCTTEIAAFDEFTGLLVNSGLTAGFDHIIFDTAPTGHTIRMLQLPGAWSGFLEEGKGDASCLGPLAGLEKQRAQYKAAVRGSGRRKAHPPGSGRPRPAIDFARGRPHPDGTRGGRPWAAISRHQRVAPARRSGAGPARRRHLPTRAGGIGGHSRRACEACRAMMIALLPFNLVGVPALRQLLTGTTPPHRRR